MRIIVLLFLLINISIASAEKASEYVLTLSDQPSTKDIQRWKTQGIVLEKQIFEDPIMYRVFVSDEARARKVISTNKSVMYFRKAVLAEERATIPNDPQFMDQWHLDKIGAPEAWDFATTGKTSRGIDIVLGIFDSGYEKDHPDLANIFWKNENETPGDGIDNDSNGYIDDYCGVDLFSGNDQHKRDRHGTQVIGAMAAESDNGIGVSGIAWNTKVIPISKSVGNKYDTHFIESINYLIQLRKAFNESNGQEGAFVVAMNTSLGVAGSFASEFPDWCAVHDAMGQVGILGVYATENESHDVDIVGDMPANCPSEYIIAVTSSDKSDRLDEDAAFGQRTIDLAAPGHDILTTNLNGGYDINSGTSLASPLVTGAIAAMYMAASDALLDTIALNPAVGALEIRRLLLESVHITSDLTGRVASNGRLDLAAAVEAARSYIGSNAADNFSMSVPQPNPVQQDINVILSLPNLDPVEFTIIRIPDGREVLRVQSPAFLRVGDMSYTIPSPSLPAGAYVLRAKQRDETVAQKIIILRP